MDIKYFAHGKPHLIKQEDFVEVATSEELPAEIKKEIDIEILNELKKEIENKPDVGI